MKFLKTYISVLIGTATVALTISGCKKDGNPNNLPSVSPGDYVGLVEGYSSSDQIFPKNLIAYWPFDDAKADKVSGITPTSTANDALVDGGVRGKALSLTGGYLYYGTQFPKFKTDSLKSFSISVWIQILNNGSKKTEVFQLARPGMLNGNIDLILETDINPASNTDYIRIHPYFTTVGGGRQDNVNAFGSQNLSPTIGSSKWTHLVVTYDGSSGTFNIWGDGVKIGNYPNRGTGTSLFKSWEPNEVIIGGNYNTIPGKSVSTDASFAAMTGSIDELRVYNIALPDAHIKALFNLGKAKK